MNKPIGVLLVGVAGLMLLLFTCTGPGSGESEVVATTAGTGAGPSDVSPAPTEELDLTSPTESVTGSAPAADAPSSKPVRVPVSSSRDARPASASVLPETAAFVPAALPIEPLPVADVEALLAVPPRALEGGTGRGVLLVPADSLREHLRLPIAAHRSGLPTDYTRGQPVSTINTPTAYGQQLGDVYGGLGYQDRIRYADWRDGVAAVGLGLGDPVRYVGVDVAVSLLDTYTDFAEDRSLSLKLHRRLPYRSAVAVGHENLWHTDGTDGGSSRYVVVSKVLLLRDRPTAALGSMVVNAGLGTDRFLSEARFARRADGVNAFGSVAVRVLPPVNAVANWTGQDLALGLSIAPVRTWPLVVTPAVVDVTGRAGDGARFAVGAGLNYRFRR